MAKESSNKTVVRRVKASTSDSAPKASTENAKKLTGKSDSDKQSVKAKNTSKKAPKLVRESKTDKNTFLLFKPFVAIGNYFRNSWRELKQVHWPNRRATWALTLAVILFSLFFILMIMLFDWIFNFIMQEVIL